MTEWSENRIQHLRKRWAEGATASTIAQEMNAMFGGFVSRSVIVGKAHRLGLAGLPSPIKTADPAASAAKRAKTMRGNGTHKSGARSVQEARQRTAKPAERPAAPVNLKRVTIPAVAPVARTSSGFAAASSRETCAWPIGDPKHADFHFCGAKPVMPGKPYCDAHCAIAYRKPEQPADDAAGKEAA